MSKAVENLNVKKLENYLKDWDLVTLSQAIGASEGYMRKVLKEQNKMSHFKYAQLCNFLGVETDSFLIKEEEEKIEPINTKQGLLKQIEDVYLRTADEIIKIIQNYDFGE